MKTATLPQEDWDLILYLLQAHSDRYRRDADEAYENLYSEMLRNAAAETDDLYFRIQQQVGQ